MPINKATGLWEPNLSPKQFEVFNCYKRATLVSGPRLSAKTRAVLHKIVRHAWECDGARVGFFARTMKSTKDGGAWSLLHKTILPEWIDANIGLRYTTDTRGVPGQKVDGTTRTPFCRIRNCKGGESEFMLFSLDNDGDAEAKLKELEFSCIYFSELDKFHDRQVLTVALPSLRIGHLSYDDQFWIADCNPSEEGEESWIYKLFYLERNMSYEQYVAHQKREDLPTIPETDFTDFYKSLAVIEMLPKDNPFVDQRQLQEVRVSCGADRGLYARHVEGKWIWGGGDASRHFRGVFNEHIHVLGSAPDNELLMPTPNCWELVTGWDLGEATNHAACIMDRSLIGPDPVFYLLDELVSIGKEVTIEEFTRDFMALIDAIEKDSERPTGHFGLESAWSDRSSLEKFAAVSGTYPHMVVHAASKERIALRGVPKPYGSIQIRVNLLKQLLREQRFFVSAQCRFTIRMLKHLKKGPDRAHFVIEDENKHIFDAITYALLMECAQELRESNTVPLAIRESLAVSIR